MRFIEYCIKTSYPESNESKGTLNVDHIINFLLSRNESVFRMEIRDNGRLRLYCSNFEEAELIYDAFKRGLQGEDVEIAGIGYIRHLHYKSPKERVMEDFENRLSSMRIDQEIKTLEQLEEEGIAKPYSRCFKS